MNPQDLSLAQLIIEHFSKVVVALIGILLIALKLLGKKQQANAASAILHEKPVSHAELMTCQLHMTDIINNNFKDLQKQFISEVRVLHKRMDRMEDRNDLQHDKQGK